MTPGQALLYFIVGMIAVLIVGSGLDFYLKLGLLCAIGYVFFVYVKE